MADTADIEPITDETLTDDDASVIRMQSASASSFSGPLPHPDILHGYEEVEKGFANRIMLMAEAESQHRHQMERRAIELEAVALQEGLLRARQGLYLAAIVALMFLAASTAIAVFVDTVAGSVLSGVDIALLAGVFVYGVRRRSLEQESEQEEALAKQNHDRG